MYVHTESDDPQVRISLFLAGWPQSVSSDTSDITHGSTHLSTIFFLLQTLE